MLYSYAGILLTTTDRYLHYRSTIPVTALFSSSAKLNVQNKFQRSKYEIATTCDCSLLLHLGLIHTASQAELNLIGPS